MAIASKAPCEVITSAVASEDIELEGSGQYSALLIQAVFGTYNGSFTVEGAAHESGATAITIGYEDRATGSISAAAVTADKIIVVPTSGMDVQIATTGRTAGTLTLYIIPILSR